MRVETLQTAIKALELQESALIEKIEEAIQAHKYAPILPLREQAYEVADALQDLKNELKEEAK